MSAQKVFYGAAADEIVSLFSDYFTGSSDRPFLVISYGTLGEAAQVALQKSFQALGYDDPACSYLRIAPSEALAPLDSQAQQLLIEGVDPYRMICADKAARQVLQKTYGIQLVPNAVNRIMGRSCGVFDDLNDLVQNETDKYIAWEIFKALK